MQKRSKITYFVAAAIALPLIGYVVTYGATHISALSEQPPLFQGLFTLAITLALLAVPFLFLKSAFHATHMANHHERELHLKDIPKDKEQLNRTAR